MLRWVLTYLSQADWARNVVQRWGFARRTASRFVAGETLDQALLVVQDLNARGITTTLDHLGEHVSTPEAANIAADEILLIIDRLDRENVSSGVSIKLSQIGLVIDEQICEQNLVRILQQAREKGIFVRVDMEDSQLIDATLDVFGRVISQGFQDYAGIALQAYLYRTEEDLRALLANGIRIRLCKGAYKEPRTLAYPKKRSVDENFDHLTDLLLEKSLELNQPVGQGGKIPPLPAIATHDLARVEHALEQTRVINLDSTCLEFQMLHGIREDLQADLVNKGFPVRVYVPYGQEWYPYFVRRLAERPANLWFFISNLLRTK